MAKKRAFTIIELLVVACVFMLMFAILTPFVQRVKSRANRIYCSNNLRQISLGLHKYALEHKKKFPAALRELYPGYVKDEDVFDCPAGKLTGTKNEPDYVYTSGLTEGAPGQEIIVQDKDGNHKKAGRNVLRVNGSVEWVGTY